MAWNNESMIKAIEGALESERAVKDNSGLIGMSFQIAEQVLIPLLEVGVIRCKQCKWFEPTPDKEEPDRGYCNGACNSLPAVHEDWYCADAELPYSRGE